MLTTEEIREAVELAEGFAWDDNTLTKRAFIALPNSDKMNDHDLDPHWRECTDPTALDALAAQLARQYMKKHNETLSYADNPAEVIRYVVTNY